MTSSATIAPSISASPSSASDANPALIVSGVTHRYGDRTALDNVSLSVARGERFAILGPNGGGKSTLFRLITTLAPIQAGQIQIQGRDVVRDSDAVRRRLGVVFQAASLDDRLSVAENLRLHAAMYGVPRSVRDEQIERLSGRLGFADRLSDRVGTLSGGLRRRVELARGLFHGPEVLILDEPTTGLDVGARREFWAMLEQARQESGMTIVYTTHLLDEAERADRLILIDAGKIVAEGRPDDLTREVGGDTITITAGDLPGLLPRLEAQLGHSVTQLGEELRFETADAATLVPQLLSTFPREITTVRIGRPSLEDVFIRRTGRTFTESTESAKDKKAKSRSRH